MYVHSRCSAWGARGLKVCVLHTERTLTKQWHGGSRWNLLDSSLWDRKRGQACAQPLVAPHPARTQISFLEPTSQGMAGGSGIAKWNSFGLVTSYCLSNLSPFQEDFGECSLF